MSAAHQHALEAALQKLLTFTHASTDVGRQAQDEATALLKERALPQRNRVLTIDDLRHLCVKVGTPTCVAMYEAMKELK